VYQSLKPVFSTSFALWPFYLVFWTHRIFTHLLITTSTSSRNLPVRDPTFQLSIRILVGLASFLTLRTRRGKCENPCSFFTTPGRRCSAPLRWWPDPCSLIIVPRSRYDAPLGGWRPGPYPFNTTPGFRCSASLRGLRSNEFLMDFISIRVTFFFTLVRQILTQPSSFARAWDRLCWDDSRNSSSQYRRSSPCINVWWKR
jgi:hypothetical protein